MHKNKDLTDTSYICPVKEGETSQFYQLSCLQSHSQKINYHNWSLFQLGSHSTAELKWMQRSLTSKETFNCKEMMNKKFIKLFTFCLFKEQAASCTKSLLNKHSSVKGICNVIKKIINVTIFTNSTNLYSTNESCIRET